MAQTIDCCLDKDDFLFSANTIKLRSIPDNKSTTKLVNRSWGVLMPHSLHPRKQYRKKEDDKKRRVCVRHPICL